MSPIGCEHRNCLIKQLIVGGGLYVRSAVISAFQRQPPMQPRVEIYGRLLTIGEIAAA